MKRLGIGFTLVVALAGCEIIAPPIGTPTVSESTPTDGATNVAPGAAVKLKLELPNGGVSLTSANDSSVMLINEATGEQLSATVRVDNDSERLTLTPSDDFEFDTTYRFDLTSTVEDEVGRAFEAYSATFTTIPEGVPAILRSRPADGESNVSTYDTAGIASDLSGIGGGVDRNTLTTDNVYVTNLTTGARVPGRVDTSGGDDTINFSFDEPLEDGNEYQLDITSRVLAGDGTPYIPYTSTFIAGTLDGPPDGTGEVEVVFQETSNDVRHSSLTFGPDGNLYAAVVGQEARIVRYSVGSDGSLGAPETITTISEPDGSPRLVIGLTFDPTATADNLIAWISSTSLNGFDNSGGGILKGNEAWSGKITRLSGPTLSTQQDVVTGLPRSTKDHVTNSIAFNPAEPGVLYFNQGSNTAMGAPDDTWRYRPETALSGAVLRLNYSAIGSGTLNVQTDDGGTYDPFVSGAPLTVYASGTRNSYDLVWHSNGNLYVPANGSASGGNIPLYDPPDGACEARGDYSGPVLDSAGDLPGYIPTGPEGQPVDGWKVNQTMNDYLFNIEKGGYYGTPNPARCEWILFGGGVGTGDKLDIIDLYPSSVQPDPNYRGYAHSFGQNVSPNGVIEYQGDAFSQYNGMLLVARYSVGDNIVAIELDSSGNVTSEQPVVPNNTFDDPIDLTQDPNTGYIYVSSYDQNTSGDKPIGLTLLRPE